MRRVRPFVVLLMSLAVCLQGHAAMRMMDASCPMQHAHAAHTAHAAAAMPAHDAHGHDHHHDQGQTQESASSADNASTHHCQSHLGCDPLSAGMITAQVFPVFRQPVAQAPAGATPAFHSYTAFLLWRPPARS
jgi:hypothetical protein